MHTTQISLEDWQYEALQSLADREQRSISAVIREMLTSHLARQHEMVRQRLAAIEGIGDDLQATGQEHDAFLYRMP
jgi:hypothetical protein